MAHLQLVKQTSSGLLLPATPESGDFLRSVKIGEWIHADFKRVRNYAFHKRFLNSFSLVSTTGRQRAARSHHGNRNLSPGSLIFFATPLPEFDHVPERRRKCSYLK